MKDQATFGFMGEVEGSSQDEEGIIDTDASGVTREARFLKQSIVLINFTLQSGN